MKWNYLNFKWALNWNPHWNVLFPFQGIESSSLGTDYGINSPRNQIINIQIMVTKDFQKETHIILNYFILNLHYYLKGRVFYFYTHYFTYCIHVNEFIIKWVCLCVKWIYACSDWKIKTFCIWCWKYRPYLYVSYFIWLLFIEWYSRMSFGIFSHEIMHLLRSNFYLIFI